MYLFTAKVQSYDPKIDQVYNVQFLVDGDRYEEANKAIEVVDKAIETIEKNGKVLYIEWCKIAYATDWYLSSIVCKYQYNESDFIRDFNGDF